MDRRRRLPAVGTCSPLFSPARDPDIMGQVRFDLVRHLPKIT